MIRALVIIFALIAPFLFPWPFTVVLALSASYFFPPIALVVGAIAELMYGTGPVPYVFIGSGIAFLVMAGVRRFVKARIIGV